MGIRAGHWRQFIDNPQSMYSPAATSVAEMQGGRFQGRQGDPNAPGANQMQLAGQPAMNVPGQFMGSGPPQGMNMAQPNINQPGI
ncbi:hypothetical protein CMI37_01600, partial [Candidatus Pacearchaeota archaeon]|nr:hypothetical protein [Candidatus Pacearchaeota archaeon]